MALKIPVYVYDKFGGPGYINKKNIEINRKYNFSGRNFKKKSSLEIVNDIIQNFDSDLENLEYIYNYALENFCFEKNFDDLISRVLNDEKNIDLNSLYFKYENIKRRKKIYLSLYNYSFCNGYALGKIEEEKRNKPELDMYKNDNSILKTELKKVENENLKHVEKIKELNSKLQQIYNSRSWKYTKFLRKGEL